MDSYQIVATLETGEYPKGIYTSDDGTSVFVANWFDNTMARIDAVKLEVDAHVTVGDGPRAFSAFLARQPDP